MLQTFAEQMKKSGNSEFYIIEVDIRDQKIPFMPIAKLNELRRELLSLLMIERLKNYKRISQKPIGYKDFYKRTFDYRANVLNSEAVSFYNNCNCKITEMALESSNVIKSGIELMRTKHCLKYAANLCSQPCGKLFLVDENGKKYPLGFDCKNCEMVVYNP
jgi:putative protease